MGVRAAKSLGGSALRSVQSQRLGQFRAEHHYEDQIEILKKEKDKVVAHPEIAQMAAIRIHNLTLQHYQATQQGPEPMSEAYVQQVSQIMQDCGVPYTTITEMMGNPTVLPDLTVKQPNPTPQGDNYESVF